MQHIQDYLVLIDTGSVQLEGHLVIPEGARGVVVFAHGSGSSRHSPRNRYVATTLQQNGLATLLLDLLTPEEEDIDRRTRQLRFDVPLLASRLVGVTYWLRHTSTTHSLKIGYFGASTGSAAALMAATQCPTQISAIVSRGGRPDLADTVLDQVMAPTLLIVGSDDFPCIGMNEDALERLDSTLEKHLEVIPGATHLFEEPGALEQVGEHASQWFKRHLIDASVDVSRIQIDTER